MSLILNGTTGISDVDGTAAAPALTGTDSNTGMFFPTADTIAFATAGTEAMRIDSSGNVGIGTTTPTAVFTNYKSLYLNGSSGSAIQMQSNGSLASNIVADTNALYLQNITAITFNTGGTGTGTERARIDSSGNLLAGGATAVFDAVDSSNSSGQGVNISQSVYRPLQVYASNGSVAAFKRNGNNGDVVVFARGSVGAVGSVSVTTTATAYNTSSDYRLKEDIVPMTGALAKVVLLKPCTYKWKVDGSDGQGFIAHELAEVVQGCVTGEKDATETVEVKDENGNITGTEVRPVYQGIDTSFLVATLTAAIQEQQALITALTTRITALEAI